MVKKKLTPAEQLLELVSDKDTQQSFQIGPKKKRVWRKVVFEVLSSRTNSLIFLIKNFRLKLTLKNLNKTLFISCIILFIYSLSGFVFQDISIKRVYKKARYTRYSGARKEVEKKPKAFLYYLEMVQRRNVFNPIELGREIIEKKVVKKKDLSKLIKEFTLVGISWSNEPVAMIEDQERKKTYFLKKGDILRDIEVKEILEDRVILIYEGFELELL